MRAPWKFEMGDKEKEKDQLYFDNEFFKSV